MDSAQHSPSRIIPQLGQVSENTSKPSRSEHWRVLHEDEARSNFTDDSGHLHPHPASLALDSGSLAGGADVLTGKPARNHVNNPPPRSSVKGANVIPNRERRENAFILPAAQNSSGVGFPLDSADGAPLKELSPEYAATSACE